MDVPISGHCGIGFDAVLDEFRANFAERGEVGASVCVVRGGQIVVDLWGGWADEARTVPWQRDTVVNFYSVGKAIVATLLLQVVDRGEIGLDTPVVDVWPDFGAHGKHRATVRDALCHRAAVPAIRRPLTNDDLQDWATMTDAVAATEPWWEIGTRHAYHTNTFGYLVGEIVRRVTGDEPRRALHRVTADLDADVWFGVPTEHRHRCADVMWDSPAIGELDITALAGDALMNALAHFNPPGVSSVGIVNTPEWRDAVVPSTNGHGTATGLAAVYAALLEPDRVLSAPLLAEATRPQSVGPCPILGDDVAFGLGFTPTTDRRPLGPNPGSFGHFGTGGALGFADPVAGIAFGYVMNHVIPRWQSTRNRALIDGVYRT